MHPFAVEGLATRESLPSWLVERWVARLGLAGGGELARAQNRRPEHGLRLGAWAADDRRGALLEELQAAGVELAPGRLFPDEYMRVRRGLHLVLRSEQLARGDVGVQDEAAGAAVRLLDPRPGQAVLDACAAPGSKTLAIAARMQGRGRLLACDVSTRRLAKLQALVATLSPEAGGTGLIQPRARAVQALDEDPELAQGFDRVLLDVPCTGTGVLSKKPDARWRRSPEDLARAVKLQVRVWGRGYLGACVRVCV